MAGKLRMPRENFTAFRVTLNSKKQLLARHNKTQTQIWNRLTCSETSCYTLKFHIKCWLSIDYPFLPKNFVQSRSFISKSQIIKRLCVYQIEKIQSDMAFGQQTELTRLTPCCAILEIQISPCCAMLQFIISSCCAM